MKGKKIEFTKKPTAKIADEFIDNWVSGNTKPKKIKQKVRRTTMYLSEEIYKKLKIKSANENISMTEIIAEILKNHLI